MVVVRDDTDYQRYEDRLREEVSFSESVLNSQRDMVYAFDTSGQFLRWNDQLQAVTGYTDAEIATMGPTEFIADGDVPAVAEAIDRVFAGESTTVEADIATSDGETIPYEFSGTPITDRDGRVVGLTGVGRDVTERKLKERRLKRQRAELQRELEDVFTRIDDAFLAVDEGRFVHANERAAAVFDRSPESLVGRDAWATFDDVFDAAVETACKRAVETQDSASFETYAPEEETWFEVNLYPSESGLSMYFRDITERKERERDLSRYETLYRESKDANMVVDADGRFSEVTPTAARLLGYDPDDLTGESMLSVVHPDDRETAREQFTRLLDDPSREPQVQLRLERHDGDRVIVEAAGRNLLDDPAVEGVVVYMRDVTERVERERELELYETIVETIEDGVYVLDEDFCFTEVNDAYVEMTGYDRAELLGSHCSLVVSEDVSNDSRDRMGELASEGGSAVIEADIQCADGTTIRAESRFSALSGTGGHAHKVGVVRDVRDRVSRERELRDRVQQQEVVAEFGQRALEASDLDALFDEASAIVAETLGNDYCKVLDLDAQADELFLRAGVGWNDGVVGSATVSAIENESQASYTLSTEAAVVVENLETETRFSGPDLLRDHDVRSGISTTIGPTENPWGILGTHDTEVKEFSLYDANFVQSVANILASAIGRHRHERKSARRREQLTALNSLNEVVRETTEAIIEKSTREEIERTVCDHLAATDSYLFAWTGEVDSASETVRLRTESGVEGYLDDLTISVDPDDEKSEGPTGRALRTGETQTIQHADADPQYEPWWDITSEYGFRSSAAVPITHESTTYGVLNVYSDRPEAFERSERRVISQLGEVVGHAIAAVDRKQALLSDEVVELELLIPNFLSAYEFEQSDEESIYLDHTVPVGDDEYLIFGHTTPEGLDTVRSMADELPFYEDVTVRGEGDEPRFELSVSKPPILSVVASMGGSIEGAVVENGEYQFTVHLPPSVDVGRVIDAVTDAEPDVTLLKRQQLTLPDQDESAEVNLLTTDLTERQYTALETAYHAGFFGWPRDATGEDVADALNIAPPTFHQHLRKSQRKVFDAMFGGGPA